MSFLIINELFPWFSKIIRQQFACQIYDQITFRILPEVDEIRFIDTRLQAVQQEI